MAYIIEHTAIKTLLRIVGIFVTFLAVVGAVDSIALLLGGLEKGNPWPIFFGLGVFTSYFGIVGAWIRISNQYTSLSKKKVQLIRRLLGLGIAGSILLAVGSLWLLGFRSVYGSAIFIALGAVGVFFIKQTPSKP